MRKYNLLKYIIWICILVFVFALNLYNSNSVNAQEFSSTNFKLLDPVIAPAGFASSSSFQLWSTLSEVAVGTSSAASFSLGGGFLRFPFASSPVVSATPGANSVSLSWTSSNGYVGWSVSGYSIAQASVSGGPYTYTNVGNTNSHIVSSLTGGSTYYFIIAAKDAFGNIVASSTEVVSTAGSSSSGGGGGGGGGGGSSGGSSQTGIIFSGRAYPLSKISILKDGEKVLTTIAGPDSKFTAQLYSLSSGNYNFSVYGEDKNGLRSSPFTFPIYITQNITTTVSGIFIAPTITTDKTEVAKGDNIIIFGQTSPDSEVTININSEPEYFVKRPSDKDGVYLLNFDSSMLDKGKHTAKSKTSVDNEVSNFSASVAFAVGDKNVFVETGKCPKRGDLNSDCKVNLIDFSIAAFWYKKILSQSFELKEASSLNGDKIVDLKDFSIMAYYWTG